MKNVLKAIALVGASGILIFGISLAIFHTLVELEKKKDNQHFYFV